MMMTFVYHQIVLSEHHHPQFTSSIYMMIASILQVLTPLYFIIQTTVIGGGIQMIPTICLFVHIWLLSALVSQWQIIDANDGTHHMKCMANDVM